MVSLKSKRVLRGWQLEGDRDVLCVFTYIR